MTTNRRDTSSYDRCRRQRVAEYDAYYSTVLVTVGLKDMFTDDEPCTFKVSEPRMITSSSSPMPRRDLSVRQRPKRNSV